MKFFTGIPEAFHEGILEASTTKAKVLRWSSLIALWLIALICAVLSALAFAFTTPLQGATFIFNSLTMLFLSGAVIYNSATSEILKKF